MRLKFSTLWYGPNTGFRQRRILGNGTVNLHRLNGKIDTKYWIWRTAHWIMENDYISSYNSTRVFGNNFDPHRRPLLSENKSTEFEI